MQKFCAVLFISFSVLANFGCNHKAATDTTALRNIVIEGSGIGAVVAELRRKNELPIQADHVLAAHRQAFRSYWNITTNSQGFLELKENGSLLWSIDARDGTVRIVGVRDHEKAELLALFERVDFSKPLSTLNAPTVEPDVKSVLIKEADSVWKYYIGTE